MRILYVGRRGVPEKWTDEALRKEALKYKTRGEFVKGSAGAYAMSRRRGMDFHKEVCQHMIYPRKYRTDEEIFKEALKYTTLVKFRTESFNVYDVARKRGILAKAIKHMIPTYIKWTKEMVRLEALKFNFRGEFQKKSHKAYKSALRNGWIDEVCTHMKPVLCSWTVEKIHAEALRYTTKSDFRYQSYKAYRAAKSYGVVEKVCSHMKKSKSTSDDNVIYIWQDLEYVYGNKNIYKIGVTSEKCQHTRVPECACKAGITQYKIIILQKILGSAKELEKEILKLGDDPGYSGFKGYTEFRAFSKKELSQALKLIASNVGN